MPRELYDWITISKEYIQGIQVLDPTTNARRVVFPTHEELCEKYGFALITIRNRAQDEKWYLQRAQFKRKLKLKSTEIDNNDLLAEGTKFDSLHLSNLEKVQKIINSFLDPYIEMIDNGGWVEEGSELKAITSKDLHAITSCIKNSHDTVTSILGHGSTQSLLEEIQEQYAQSKKNREFSKTRMQELTKQLSEADKLKKELEERKKEIQNKLNPGKS